MTNLSEIQSRVTTLLMDTAHLTWPEEILVESIRQALEEYNLAAPSTAESSFLLEKPEMEIDLSGLPGFREILALHYPWEPESEGVQPPNQIRGWHTWLCGGKPFAALRAAVRLEGGHYLKTAYLASHSLAGLDGAEATSFPIEHNGLIVRGACAFAALSRALDKVELRDYGSRRSEPELLSHWGLAQMTSFHDALSTLRQSLPPFPCPHWQMDRWDNTGER